MRQKEYNYRLMQEQRNQRLQNEMPVVQTLYKQLEETGKFDPQLYSQISTDNPLNPGRFFGQDAINNVMEVNRVMPKVLAGEMNYNDPKVIKLMNTVLSPHIQRGIGEVDPQTGKKIVSKELGHIGVSEDGKFIIPGLKVKYDDGTTAEKPMTELGSADERDNQIAHMPVARFMDEIRGYGQMVGQINQPDRAAFLNNMVNPPDKTATREEAKGLRRDLLDVGKARARALSEAMDKDAIAGINAQYDLLQNQVLENYGQPGKTADSFEDFANEYQKENGAPPDPKNGQDIQFYQQWKALKQSGSVAQSFAKDQPLASASRQVADSHTAQQLREFRRLSQTN
ncbi:Uncharacterised protein [Serratia marcescens]|nr:Uncharacterised protein [Serratia marcescens]